MSQPRETGGLIGEFPYWGMDGCNGAWLCVGLNDVDGVCSFVACDIACAYRKIRKHGGEIILIDIPIGLPWDERPRCCDVMARKLVGKRWPSVFSAPSREAAYTFVKVREETNDVQNAKYEARKKNKEIMAGANLSEQTLGIIPKIYEVDAFLCSSLYAESNPKIAVREVHPELCFRMLNGYPLEHPKKNKDKSTNIKGHAERKKILCHYLPQYSCVYGKIRERPKVKDDDVHDALAAALTAKLYGHKDYETTTIPPKPSEDKCGLPMEMVYVSKSK